MADRMIRFSEFINKGSFTPEIYPVWYDRFAEPLIERGRSGDVLSDQAAGEELAERMLVHAVRNNSPFTLGWLIKDVRNIDKLQMLDVGLYGRVMAFACRGFQLSRGV